MTTPQFWPDMPGLNQPIPDLVQMVVALAERVGAQQAQIDALAARLAQIEGQGEPPVEDDDEPPDPLWREHRTLAGSQWVHKITGEIKDTPPSS